MAWVCPRCGRPVKPVRKHGKTLRVCCGFKSWGGKPMVDDRTIQARRGAHDAFDPIWRSGLITRKEAYKLLAKEMGLTLDACHMSLMDFATANKVPRVAGKIIMTLSRLKKRKEVKIYQGGQT